VLFVVLGLLIILIGRALGWQWVGNRWFRGIHLVMIVGVVIRALILPKCPLTYWEKDLRVLGEQVNAEGVVDYSKVTWLGEVCHKAIHPEDVWDLDIPRWLLPTIYSLFGALIVATFWIAPVRWRKTPTPSTGPPAVSLHADG
jgi:hypothetical protein